jgi:hypothetical protein
MSVLTLMCSIARFATWPAQNSRTGKHIDSGTAPGYADTFMRIENMGSKCLSKICQFR